MENVNEVSTGLTRKENVDMLARMVPASIEDNRCSRDRCADACGKLLREIEEHGMDGELDRKAALIIERSRKTLKKMNEGRAPVTKLFDQIRSAYTSLEKDVDPSNPESLPGRLQAMRNEYARRLHEEAERRRMEEAARMRRENEKARFEEEVEREVSRWLSSVIETAARSLDMMLRNMTLDNCESLMKTAGNMVEEMDGQWFCEKVLSLGSENGILTAGEYRDIRQKVAGRMKSQVCEQYRFEMEGNKRSVIDMMKSKKAELEAMGRTDAANAARMKEQMELREAEEAARREQERKRKEEEEAAAAAMKAEQQKVKSMFDQSAASVPSAVGVKTRKRIEFVGKQGIIDVLNMWWVNEGRNLPTEELAKKFKTQISFCEKMANGASPVFIRSEHIRYVDEVKAK